MASQVNLAYFAPRERCPVCASAEYAVIYQCPLDARPVSGFIESHYRTQGVVDWAMLAGTDYVLCACSTCGLLFQKHVPTNAALDRIYNHLISPQNVADLERSRLSVDNFNRIAGEMTVLFRMTGKHPSEITLLDFGAGHGRWARVARALGASVFITETGDQKRRMAQSLGVNVIDDEQIDSMRFDIVHTEQVFEHLVHPAREFERLARVTNCLMKVAVPRAGDVRRVLERHGMPDQSPFERWVNGGARRWVDETYIAIAPLEHLNIYSPRVMTAMAERNGMRLLTRVRRGSVSVDLTGARNLARSAADLGRMALKSLLQVDRGYYVFAPAKAS